MDNINLYHNSNEGLDVASIVMNFRILQKTGIFWTSWAKINA